MASDGEHECPICLENAAAACRTACGHTFCVSCLEQSFPPETAHASTKCPLCRTVISMYSTISVDTGKALRQPDVSTIFGTAFLQGGKPGVASYHFDSPTDCYISYEHAPAQWTLDDGSHPPAKKSFVNPTYDASTRTFTGCIEWQTTTINNGDASCT
jgi:hypothetical protein